MTFLSMAAFTRRGRKQDGGLLPPLAIQGFAVAFGELARPRSPSVCAIATGLPRSEGALNFSWQSQSSKWRGSKEKASGPPLGLIHKAAPAHQAEEGIRVRLFLRRRQHCIHSGAAPYRADQLPDSCAQFLAQGFPTVELQFAWGRRCSRVRRAPGY